MIRGLVLALCACSAPIKHADPPPVDPLAATELAAHVVALVDPALAGREAATAGERAAFDYVAGKLRAMGLVPAEQPVAFGAGSKNVYARIDGARTGEVIVIGAHVDHLGKKGADLYAGADDNASGVAVILGVTAALTREHLERSVVVVFFGAEEPGMIGSRTFAGAPPIAGTIVAMVNVDMIGRPLVDQPLYRLAMSAIGIDAERSTGLVGTRHFPALRALADTAFAPAFVVAAEDLPDDIGDEVERESAGRGDSVQFEAHGIPSLFFGDGESTDYHQPTDTLDKVTPALLEQRGRAIEKVVVELARAPASAFTRSDAVPPKRYGR